IAWCLLYEAARGVPPEIVYVNGAAGGVGTAVIDICKARGIEVIAGASSAEKCKFAAGLGANHTIDYSLENVAERVNEITGGKGADFILDQRVGPDFTDNLDMIAPLGTIVSFNALAGMPSKDLFVEMRANLGKSPGVRCFSWHTYDKDPETRSRILGDVIALFADGSLNPPIYKTLPMEEARAAHEMLDSREILGKVILKP
ncbi:MAG: zinc-binding dehydrogenase, partial [Alphaproteobacteria bacterium]